MRAGTRNIHLFMSQECFALMAEAMCEYSKRSGKFQSFRATVERACRMAITREIARSELDLFLAEYAIEGQVSVWLEISPRWSGEYDALRHAIPAGGPAPVPDKVAVPFAVYLALTHDLL
jgi:hypothetical protein